MIDDDLSDLPELLARVAEACGRGVALALAAEYGGIQAYLPEEPTADCALARKVGLVAAMKIVETLGHGHVLIPLGPFESRKRVREAIRKNLRDGKSNSKTARAVGAHERTVRRVRSKLEPEELPLFKDVSKIG
ncbi:MAG: hypothetical protein ACREEG_07050 [Phenylobacterium sp.]